MFTNKEDFVIESLYKILNDSRPNPYERFVVDAMIQSANNDEILTSEQSREMSDALKIIRTITYDSTHEMYEEFFSDVSSIEAVREAVSKYNDAIIEENTMDPEVSKEVDDMVKDIEDEVDAEEAEDHSDEDEDIMIIHG